LITELVNADWAMAHAFPDTLSGWGVLCDNFAAWAKEIEGITNSQFKPRDPRAGCRHYQTLWNWVRAVPVPRVHCGRGCATAITTLIVVTIWGCGAQSFVKFISALYHSSTGCWIRQR